MNRLTKIIIGVLLLPFVVTAYLFTIYTAITLLFPYMYVDFTVFLVFVLFAATVILLIIVYNYMEIIDDDVELPKEELNKC